MIFWWPFLGCSRDVGTSLTKMVIRHRSIYTKMKELTGWVLGPLCRIFLLLRQPKQDLVQLYVWNSNGSLESMRYSTLPRCSLFKWRLHCHIWITQTIFTSHSLEACNGNEREQFMLKNAGWILPGHLVMQTDISRLFVQITGYYSEMTQLILILCCHSSEKFIIWTSVFLCRTIFSKSGTFNS